MSGQDQGHGQGYQSSAFSLPDLNANNQTKARETAPGLDAPSPLDQRNRRWSMERARGPSPRTDGNTPPPPGLMGNQGWSPRDVNVHLGPGSKSDGSSNEGLPHVSSTTGLVGGVSLPPLRTDSIGKNSGGSPGSSNMPTARTITDPSMVPATSGRYGLALGQALFAQKSSGNLRGASAANSPGRGSNQSSGSGDYSNSSNGHSAGVPGGYTSVQNNLASSWLAGVYSSPQNDSGSGKRRTTTRGSIKSETLLTYSGFSSDSDEEGYAERHPEVLNDPEFAEKQMRKAKRRRAQKAARRTKYSQAACIILLIGSIAAAAWLVPWDLLFPPPPPPEPVAPPECEVDNDCPDTWPRCNTDTNKCVRCTHRSHCLQPSSFCQPQLECIAFECVAGPTPCSINPERPICRPREAVCSAPWSTIHLSGSSPPGDFSVDNLQELDQFGTDADYRKSVAFFGGEYKTMVFSPSQEQVNSASGFAVFINYAQNARPPQQITEFRIRNWVTGVDEFLWSSIVVPFRHTWHNELALFSAPDMSPYFQPGTNDVHLVIHPTEGAPDDDIYTCAVDYVNLEITACKGCYTVTKADCGEHGRVDPRSGLCLCDMSWTGPACSERTYVPELDWEDHRVYDRNWPAPGSLTQVSLEIFNGTEWTYVDMLNDLDGDDDLTIELPCRFQVTSGEELLTIPDGVINCRARIRGGATRRAIHKSFKVKLNDGYFWYGLNNLNLIKSPTDPLRFRNSMTYEIFRTKFRGFASLRTCMIQLTLTGAYDYSGVPHDAGLFQIIENPDEEWLKVHRLDCRNGRCGAGLYKPRGTTFDPEAYEVGQLGNWVVRSSFEKRYEPKGFNDHTKLFQLLNGMNDYETNFEDFFYAHFNLDNVLTWVSWNFITFNDDHDGTNFLMYAPPGLDNHWYFLPWDYDDILISPHPLVWKPEWRRTWGVYMKSANIFWARFLREFPNANELVHAKMREMHDSILPPAEFNQILDRWVGWFGDLAKVDPNDNTRDQFTYPILVEETKLAYSTNLAKWEEKYQYPSVIPDFEFLGDTAAEGYIQYRESVSPTGSPIHFEMTIARNVSLTDIFYQDLNVQPRYANVIKTPVQVVKTDILGFEAGVTYFARMDTVDAEGRRTPQAYYFSRQERCKPFAPPGVSCFTYDK